MVLAFTFCLLALGVIAGMVYAPGSTVLLKLLLLAMVGIAVIFAWLVMWPVLRRGQLIRRGSAVVLSAADYALYKAQVQCILTVAPAGKEPEFLDQLFFVMLEMARQDAILVHADSARYPGWQTIYVQMAKERGVTWQSYLTWSAAH